jgi:hypothetical protein
MQTWNPTAPWTVRPLYTGAAPSTHKSLAAAKAACAGISAHLFYEASRLGSHCPIGGFDWAREGLPQGRA